MKLKRLIIGLFLLLLGGSLAGNFGLFFLARWLYAERLQAQVWPEGSPSPSVASRELPGGKTILLMGDSRIADWGTPPITNARIINAGAPGCTSAQLAMRCQQLMDTTRPQIALVQVGINDLKLLGVRPELRALVVSATVSNITKIVVECHRHGVRVLLTPVWPAGDVAGLRRFVWNDAVNQALAEINHKLENIAADSDDLRKVDLFSELTKGVLPDSRKSLYRDTLHLKPEAYRALTSLLEKSVEPWLNDRLNPPPATLPPTSATHLAPNR